MLVNPTQLAVMAARLATGNIVMPHLTQDANRAPVQSLGFAPDHIGVVREAMNQVVNELGTAGRARLPVEDVKMAVKTGTAQVVDRKGVLSGKRVSVRFALGCRRIINNINHSTLLFI